jgi:hypothetical protein
MALRRTVFRPAALRLPELIEPKHIFVQPIGHAYTRFLIYKELNPSIVSAILPVINIPVPGQIECKSGTDSFFAFSSERVVVPRRMNNTVACVKPALPISRGHDVKVFSFHHKLLNTRGDSFEYFNAFLKRYSEWYVRCR